MFVGWARSPPAYVCGAPPGWVIVVDPLMSTVSWFTPKAIPDRTPTKYRPPNRRSAENPMFPPLKLFDALNWSWTRNVVPGGTFVCPGREVRSSRMLTSSRRLKYWYPRSRSNRPQGSQQTFPIKFTPPPMTFVFVVTATLPDRMFG